MQITFTIDGFLTRLGGILLLPTKWPNQLENETDFQFKIWLIDTELLGLMASFEFAWFAERFVGEKKRKKT